MSLFAELKRRKVFRVMIVYGIVAWVLIQAADILLGNFAAPEWVFRSFVVLLVLGFPVALFLAWAFEPTEDRHPRWAEEAPTSWRDTASSTWPACMPYRSTSR